MVRKENFLRAFLTIWEITKVIKFDTREFRNQMERLQRELAAGAERGVEQAVTVALRIAKESDAFLDRTGQLRNSLKIVRRGPFRMRLVANAKYASYVDEGTKPHTIRARHAPFLVFTTEGGERLVLKSVKHPGNAPRGFMKEASERGERALLQNMQDVVSRVAQTY